MPTVLLTGAGSILGCPLAALLADAGCSVIALFRTRNHWVDKLENHGGIKLVQVNLDDSRSLDDSRLQHCEIVIHLAATSPRPKIGVAELVRDNIVATGNLVSFAIRLGVRRFIFMSSMSVYGQVSMSAVGALTPIINPSPYGMTKRLCEQQLEDVSNRMASVALRIPALLGRGAHRHWLAGVMERAIKGDEITIHNPAAPYNNAVDVDHLSSFVASLLDREWTGFHALPLGARGFLPIKEVVHRIVEGMQSRSLITARESSATSFTIDFSDAERDFGYAPPGIDTVIDRYVQASR